MLWLELRCHNSQVHRTSLKIKILLKASFTYLSHQFIKVAYG
ncbi:hypothetical protein CASFOL_030207 [Castilleja foliolosa]|uniref:Uncharacterized protein n=1 Tax=Castilleja foliolosa TaxID=1961234 RepID=A0ABD3CAR0_9LAMI